MASILATPYRPPELGWLGEFFSQAARMAAERDARQKSIAMELARSMEQKRQFDIKADFDAQQQERAARQFDAKMAFDREREASDLLRKKSDREYRAGRDRIADARYQYENAPFDFSLPPLPETGTEKVPQSADNSFIKLSNYGYASDTTPDSNSMKGIGHSNNKLEDGVSAALSKSLATRLGLKTGDWLNIQTTKGPMRVRYDDTVPTLDSRVAGPLPETIDIFRRDGSNDWGGKVTGIETEKSVPANLTPGQKVRNVAAELAALNAGGGNVIPRSAARDILTGAAKEFVRGSTRANAGEARSEILGNGDRVIYDRSGNIEAIVGADNVARRLPSAAPEMRATGGGQIQLGSKILNVDSSGKVIGDATQLSPSERMQVSRMSAEAKADALAYKKERDAAADAKELVDIDKKWQTRLAYNDLGVANQSIKQITEEMAKFRADNPKYATDERKSAAFAEIESRLKTATKMREDIQAGIREINEGRPKPYNPIAPGEVNWGAGPRSEPGADEKVSVIHPDGRSGKIPRSQLDAALKAGYRQK